MSRTLLNSLISTAFLLGNVSTSSWPANAASSTVQAGAVQVAAAPSNQSPLPPGGAAGIKEAQGLEGGPHWLEAGLAIGAVIAIWLLMDDSDFDDATTTTGM